MPPRARPTLAATAITMRVNLTASLGVGQTAFLSSATVSGTNLKREGFLGARVLLSLGIERVLFYLAVGGVDPAMGAVLPKLQPLGVILLVLFRGVISLLTLTAGQVDDGPGFPLFGHSLFQDLGEDPGADSLAPFSHGEAEPLLQGHRVDKLDVEVDSIPRHHHLHPLG